MSYLPAANRYDVVAMVRKLNEIARARNQSLAQMALAWVLRHAGVTSAVVGASRVSQLEDAVAALKNLELAEQELLDIDRIVGKPAAGSEGENK